MKMVDFDYDKELKSLKKDISYAPLFLIHCMYSKGKGDELYAAEWEWRWFVDICFAAYGQIESIRDLSDIFHGGRRLLGANYENLERTTILAYEILFVD